MHGLAASRHGALRIVNYCLLILLGIRLPTAVDPPPLSPLPPAVFFITSLRRTASIQVLLSTLFFTFVLLAGGVQNSRCNQAAGYFGMLCAGSALYAATIVLVKTELGYTLPGNNRCYSVMWGSRNAWIQTAERIM